MLAILNSVYYQTKSDFLVYLKQILYETMIAESFKNSLVSYVFGESLSEY